MQFSGEEPRLFKTCMFTTYMDDYVPAIMREINSLYDVDCFYTNGWPPIGSLPECHCAICSKLPPSGTPAYWRVFNDRVFELWQKYDAIAKEKKPDSFFFANLGGNVRGGPNLDRLGKIAAWFQADNQGRTYDDPAIWGCSLQGRVCNAVMDGKFAANVTAAYSTGTVTLAQCLQESRRSQDVAERNAGQRHGSLLPLHRLGERVLAKTAAGKKSAPIISTGRQSTMPT